LRKHGKKPYPGHRKKKNWYLPVINGKFFAEYLISSMNSVSTHLVRLPSTLHIMFTINTANGTEDERITEIKHMRGTRTAGI
jgi:hypothetical protein